MIVLTLGFRRAKGINVFFLFGFVGITGFNISPFLSFVIKLGQSQLIYLGFFSALVVFILLSVFVHRSKQDFSFLGSFLFSSLFILIVVAITSVFYPISINWLIYYSVSLITFCGFVLYDTSRVILKYAEDEYISAVIDLYLDFINIFVDFIRIFIEIDDLSSST